MGSKKNGWRAAKRRRAWMIGDDAADRDHACNRERQSGNGIQQHGGALNVRFEAKVEIAARAALQVRFQPLLS